MTENIVDYNSNYFKDRWHFFLKISPDKRNDIPTYIRSILRSKFEKEDKWVERRGDILGGVHNTGHKLDNKGRSLLNYLDTNYNAFTELINFINRKIMSKDINGYTQIDFYLSNTHREIGKLFDILKNYKDYIFENDELLTGLFTIIKRTSKYGNDAEYETIKRIKKFDGVTDIEKMEFGHVDDQLSGIDIKFKYNGKENAIQAKYYTDMRHQDGKYYFRVGHPKNYKYVNILSFWNKKMGFYMFRNDPSIKIKGSYYIIPDRLKYNNI